MMKAVAVRCFIYPRREKSPLRQRRPKLRHFILASGDPQSINTFFNRKIRRQDVGLAVTICGEGSGSSEIDRTIARLCYCLIKRLSGKRL
jgi:hypothetical protein